MSVGRAVSSVNKFTSSEPDSIQTEVFLNALWHEKPPQGALIAVGMKSSGFYDGQERENYTGRMLGSVRSVQKYVQQWANKYDLYYHPVWMQKEGIGSKSRGTEQAAVYGYAIHADIDVASKEDAKRNYPTRLEVKLYLKDCPFPPSAVIESGSGGYHVYWFLTEPVPAEMLKPILPRFIKFLASTMGRELDQRGSTADLMRLPGSIHHKSGQIVAVSELHPDRRYPIKEIISFLDSHAPHHAVLPCVVSIKETCNQYKEGRGGGTTSQARRKLKLVGRKKRYLKPKINLAQPLTPILHGQIEEMLQKEWVGSMLVESVLGLRLPDVANGTRSEALCCILPSHEEKNPSATVYQTDAGGFVYVDHHLRGERKNYDLPTVYASIKYGYVRDGVGKLSPSEWHLWAQRMFIEAQILPPFDVPLKLLPDEASRNARKLYDGFRLLLQCRWHYIPGDPAPFAYDLIRAWCFDGKKSHTSIKNAFDELRDTYEVIDCVGIYKRTKLYSPVWSAMK